MNQSPPSVESKLELPSDVERDIVELGPENPWKPSEEWEDSRYKYPMGSMIPKPNDGWTGSEKDDFMQAIEDHWEPYKPGDTGREWSPDELWRHREHEKCTYWNKYKKLLKGGIEGDANTGEQCLDSSPERLAHLGLNMQVGDWPEWEYHEVEKEDPLESG